MDFAVFAVVVIGILYFTTLVVVFRVAVSVVEERAATLDKHQAERKDLIDRLMARDLTEVKQAQAIAGAVPRAVSKSRNEARLVEEARKAAEGRYIQGGKV